MSSDRAYSLPTFDQLWAETIRRHDLRLSSLKGDISSCKTIEDVIGILEEDESTMKAFRARGQKIRDTIKPFVNLVRLFVDAGAEGAASKGVPGGKAVFTAFGVLLAATKGVSRTYDALEELLSKLQGFLERLDTYLAEPELISAELKKILVRILEQLLEVLVICAKRFDKEVSVLQKLIPKRAKDYVKVLLGDNQVQDALEKLDKLTNEEQQRSIAEVLLTSKAAARDVKEVRKEQQEVKEAVHNMREELLSSGITQWLSPPDPSTNHHNASKTRQSETGDWFFDRQFVAWKETENGVYWIHGKPGSGKSVLFSSIVDKLQSEGMLAYFYFDFRDPVKQTLRGLLLSLVYQLAVRSRDCFSLLQKFHADHRAFLSPPIDDKLFDCLKAMLQASGRVYILVDALDECPESSRHDSLLPFLEEIIALCCNGLRLLVTSRPEDDVRECLLPIATERLNLHELDEQSHALARHVTDKLANDRDYRGWSESLRLRAKQVLVTKAGGMFLWADLQLKTLRGRSPDRVYELLNTLPRTLQGVYERILKDIPEVDSLLARRVFECIAFAERPLTPGELAGLNVISDGTTHTSQYHSAADLEHWLLRVCSSFIQIVDRVLDWEDKRVVQFVHFSAQEYLLSIRSSDHVAEYRLNAVAAHTTLATLCLTVLNSPVFDPASLLTDYAVCNWMIHVWSVKAQETLRALLSELLDANSPSFSRWIQELVNRSEYEYNFDCPYNECSTPLYVAVHLGLDSHIHELLRTPGVNVNASRAPLVYAAAITGNVGLTRLLLKHGARVDEDSSRGWTALHVAAYQGHHEIVRLLLDQGAAFHAREKEQRTPLHLAAQNGHLEVARLLLERGAAADAREGAGRTPLHLAAQNGRLDVALLLFERGAAVDVREQTEQTPLHYAAQKGHIEVARLLLDRGAAVDARNQNEETPLLFAVRDGHLEVFRLLLERSAAIDVCSEDGWTPLHFAARDGNLKAARLLLERGATVDARKQDDATPLHLAVDGQRLEVVRLLLEEGAAVDACNKKQQTPLYLAAWRGHFEIARLLLERDAAVDARQKYEWTPLHFAAQGGHLEVVHLLLERGSAVDARDGDEETPLHFAAQGGHLEVARSLIERGAAVDAREINEWTSLHFAARNGHLQVALLLLERGAAIEARTKAEWKPLHSTAQNGQLEVLRLFLEQGAAVVVRGKSEWTPLHLAAENGYLAVAHLLLERGAAVDARDLYKRSPLHIAALVRRINVVRLLLDHGAAIELLNHNEETPLYAAASYGSVDVIRCLLDHGANLEARTDSGWTMLHGAATLNTALAVVEHMLSITVDLNQRNSAGRTPLLCAAGQGRDRAVRFLLARRANIAVCDSLGFSALEHAAAGGHAAVVRLLLKRGANHRLENAPHGSCVEIAERASRVGPVQNAQSSRMRRLREGDAQDAAQLLREAQSVPVSRADVVLRRLRRYWSVVSWGDIRIGVEGGDSGGKIS